MEGVEEGGVSAAGEGGVDGGANAVGGTLGGEGGKDFGGGGCGGFFEEAEKEMEGFFVAGGGEGEKQNFFDGTADCALPFLLKNMECLRRA